MAKSLGTFADLLKPKRPKFILVKQTKNPRLWIIDFSQLKEQHE